jgi:hypothetical protein
MNSRSKKKVLQSKNFGMRSGFRTRGGIKDVLYSYGAIVLANGNSATVVKPQTTLEYCTFNWSPTSIYAGQTAYFQAQCLVINEPLFPILDGLYAMYIQDPWGPAFGNPQPQITAWNLPYLTSQSPNIQYTKQTITIYFFGVPVWQIPAYSYYYAGPVVIFPAPLGITWYINGCVFTDLNVYSLFTGTTSCNSLVVKGVQ